MKYQITVSFEASTEELAILAFQNAIEKIAHGDGVKFKTAQLLTLKPVEAIQTLGPEDFSGWEERVKANEEVAAYDSILRDPSRHMGRTLGHLYSAPYRNEFDAAGVIDAIVVLENLEVL